MVWVRCPVYFYKRGEPFYFLRAVPTPASLLEKLAAAEDEDVRWAVCHNCAADQALA